MRYLTIGLILLLVVTGVMFVVFKGNSEELLEASISLSSSVLDVKKGKETINDVYEKYSSIITPDVMEQYNSYVNELRLRDKATINLTELYREEYEGFGDSEGTFGSNSVDLPLTEYNETDTTEKETIFEEEETNSTENETVIDISDDTRVFEQNGDKYIYVVDLDFIDGYDIVTIDSKNIMVREDQVPETYQSMINNPKYNYQYDFYREGEDIRGSYIDNVYSSVYNGHTVIIRVYHEKGKIVSFEER